MSIRILMLDLGDTLVHEGAALPHAAEALEVLAKFTTAGGKPLAICLVSDYTLPAAPGEVQADFKEYLTLLEGFGLRSYFEPVDKRVTLSTHAGVYKPDRRIFELAIKRLGLKAKLSECLFITEEKTHIAAASDLGMATLTFGTPKGFTDWAEGPLLVAGKITGLAAANIARALPVWLAANHGLLFAEGPGNLVVDGDRILAKVQQPWPLPASDFGEDNLFVPVQTTVKFRLDASGRVRSFDKKDPPADQVAEAVQEAKNSRARKEIATSPGERRVKQFVTDPQGRRVLRRMRFSGG